ncbi:unnamed protein product [Haemonchus placei]|uniref:SCP domain-containing protein n=1 Tax=Haemonchus placei TaxID=6290 RepID=A0A0N4W0K3_HAEPC|nr:unnamed protein product [Haemonchus placei]
MEDKKAHEDTWSNQQVHKTFPQNAVRVVGQPNTYVALWYHCGKPVMGRAWNDCGVMQCATVATPMSSMRGAITMSLNAKRTTEDEYRIKKGMLVSTPPQI